jgi:hypothetical protein
MLRGQRSSLDPQVIRPVSCLPWTISFGLARPGGRGRRPSHLPRFAEQGVPLTIATDGPEMMRTHLRDEFELLLKIGAVDEAQLGEANRRGHEASFVD